MTETPSNKKGFLKNLDENIQDAQAKTVDFFDNAFGGDKRTLEAFVILRDVSISFLFA